MDSNDFCLLLGIFEFEHAAYTMSEKDGLVQVCAVEASGTCKDPTHIILTTVDGSATSKPWTNN